RGLGVGLVAVALLGVGVTQRAHDGLAHSPLAAPVEERAEVVVRATLIEDPRGGPYTARVLARVHVFAIDPASTTTSAGGRTVLVTAAGDVGPRLRLLAAGDRVELAGWLAPLEGFDRRLRWRHAVGRLDATELVSFDGGRSPLARVANALRALVLRGSDYLPATERSLVAGFLLGDTRGLPRTVEEQFRAAGLTHLLAVSGANVAFVLIVVSPVLRRLGLRGRLLGGLLVLLVFGTMTRWEPSVLRACAMAACSMLALHAGRPTAGLRALALAVLVLLLADPFLVHSVAFLLSCGATAGIAVLGAPLSARVPGPPWFGDVLGVTLAAQLGVAPVLLPVFGTVPLVALPANLVAVPLAGPLTIWGLVSGVAGGVVGEWWPGGARLLQVPTTLLARAVLAVADVASGAPFAVDGRGAWGLVAAGAALAAAGRARGARRVGRHARVPPR
ncbi:MAG TPA: ComEC/Rec2 family competence protein, partial [Acidimicrobiia bacterium]